MAETRAQTPQSSVPQWLVRWSAVAWRLLIIAAALVVIGWIFTKLRLIILPVVVGLFVSTVLVPPAQWLRRRGFPPLLATWAVFLGAFLIIAGLIMGLYSLTQGQFNQLGHELSGGVNRFERYFTNGPFHFSHKQVNDYVNQAKNFFTKNQGSIVSGALSGVTIGLEIAGGVLLTLVLTFFFVKDGDRMTRWALSLFRNESRLEDMRTLGRQTWGTMAAYIRGTAANGFINATLLAFALLGLGVPLVLPLALLTFLGGFLPLVGAIVSGALAALVALVIKGPIAAIIIVGVTIVIHNVEGYIVGPKVLGHEVNLHAVVIILVIAAGTTLGGIAGAFLAVPLTAILIAVYNHYHDPARLEQPDDERGPPE
ncbi:MAG TPA: AI-2E family transporter, partial [Acidimicrobiales bacterium]|nr:AI-2E family transporter [Acidimicrobiales bacterium]